MRRDVLKRFRYIILVLLVIGFAGCWYDQDDENHPTGPDRTGVQGWTMTMTITPATAPANGSATMELQARFWNLDDMSGITGQDVYFSIVEGSTGRPAHPMEVSFSDGSVTRIVRTNGLGLASEILHVGYLNMSVFEKNFYVRAEATVDYDNNAVSVWDIHYFRLFNPHASGKPTPTPGVGNDDNEPVAVIISYPTVNLTCDEMTFDGSTSYDTDVNGQKAYDQIVSYYWFFGDGTTATGMVAKHQYEKDGDYTVELVVYDDEGVPDTETIDISISGC